MAYQAVRGMKDILPGEVDRWQAVERLAREFFPRFGFQEIRLPIMEATDLFVRSIGQATDVVEKEMYTLQDVSGESLTLRPEATAQVCRAYVEHKLHKSPEAWKVFLVGPMFRHERPQKGRLRQFHQIDCEILGLEDPEADVELIAMLVGFLEACRVGSLKVRLNSLGCPDCRPAYRDKLLGFLRSKASDLCPDCRRRLEANPLRVLDCKSENCQAVIEGAPAAVDNLCQPCAGHFGRVRAGLVDLGLDFQVDSRLVRGLDYYRRTTWEVVSEKLGGQDAVAGGGRYDGLVEALGGSARPGTGFAIGLERLLLLSEIPAGETRPDLYIAALGSEGRRLSLVLAQLLRLASPPLSVTVELTERSLKAQMRQADRLKARFTLILGENELQEGQVPLKNMAGGEQMFIALGPRPRVDQVAQEILDSIKISEGRP